MADKFDPYREALVMETNTVWPEDLAEVSAAEKSKVETVLHAAPDQCAHLEYVRVHSGFCRQITVTQGDYERARKAK
ncbi:MAG: hypothetical protein U0939_10475 [Pirellulales bacterium]